VKNDFQWRQYQGQLILLCVRWYLAFTLSYRQLERIVVLVNSDVIDNLGFGVLPSVPFRPPLFGALRLSFRFVPEPRGTAAGDPGAAPSSRRSAALGEAAQTHSSGSLPLGWAVCSVEGLALHVFFVQPSTVIGWHRKGFRLFWTWKIRRGQPGRPAVPKDIRDLIRRMSRENPRWGAPRLHSELLKLSVDVGETSVSKYLVRRRRPPSQTWRNSSLELERSESFPMSR
jgi:hypothetical protein